MGKYPKTEGRCIADDDCDKVPFRRGLCTTHYSRWKTHGDLTTVLKPGKPRQLGTCTATDDCDRPAVARDMCGKHYQRWAKFGDPLITKLDRDRTPEDRFWSRVDKNGPVPEGLPEMGPCWLWTGALREGYANFNLNNKSVDAHRIAYLWLVGAIPEGKQLDHLCHTVSIDTCKGGETCHHRRCVNPAHLDPVTGVTNAMRGLSPHALNARKTHCPKGHPYDEENTYINSEGQRICRICQARRMREWYQRKRAAEAGIDALELEYPGDETAAD